VTRRTDLRICEVVYHLSLYTYVRDFWRDWKGTVMPERPTRNMPADLLIRYAGQLYALEVKSFKNAPLYREALPRQVRGRVRRR